MTATNAERAVIEAARRVFSIRYGGARVDRLSDLKDALDHLELEYIAKEMDEPTTDERFRAALQAIGAHRALQAYDRASAVMPLGATITVTALYGMTFEQISDVRQAGPSTFAAWAAALEHVGAGLPPWASDRRHIHPFHSRLDSYRDTLKGVRADERAQNG